MEFGEAFDSAGAILTLLALLVVIPLILLMAQNIGNPEFDMYGAFIKGIFGTVGALMPAIISTLIFGILLYLYARSR